MHPAHCADELFMNVADTTGAWDSGRGRPQYVRSDFRGGVLTLHFVGPHVGQREAPIIRDSVLKEVSALGAALRMIVLDLSDVTMMASMGLGLMIDIRNLAAKQKARSVLFGCSTEIEHVIRMMKVDRLYTIVRSAAELERLAA